MTGKRRPNGIILRIELPNDMQEVLQEQMEDELPIAEKKWGYCLDEQEKQKVVEGAYQQLQCKIEELGKIYWDLGSQVSILVQYTSNVEIVLNEHSKIPKEYAGSLVHCARSGFVFVEEGMEKKACIPLADFRDYLIGRLKHWARVAVFYGVASHV